MARHNMTNAVVPLVHIVDDDASLRSALSRLLSATGYRVVLYESAAQFLEHPDKDEAGCILLDINMPGLNGLQLQEYLGKTNNLLPIIFLTAHGDISTSVRAIKAGAEDFLVKPIDRDDLLQAIERALRSYRKVHRQQVRLDKLRQRIEQLTAREREVFELLVCGMLNKQIAYKLGNTERTVKAHRRSIMEKMQVKSITELVLIAMQLGMISAKDAEDH